MLNRPIQLLYPLEVQAPEPVSKENAPANDSEDVLLPLETETGQVTHYFLSL